MAQIIVRTAERSVLVEGDSFFGFLATGAVEPWRPESKEQNTVVVKAAASAAGSFAQGGYTTVYDGVVVRGFSRRSVLRPGLTGWSM